VQITPTLLSLNGFFCLLLPKLFVCIFLFSQWIFFCFEEGFLSAMTFVSQKIKTGGPFRAGKE